MDKQNYTLTKLEVQAIQEYFESLEEELAQEIQNKLLKRKRVIKRLKDLIRAVYLYFVEQLSFQRLSDTMSCKYSLAMSDTAWRKQILSYGKR